MKKNSHKLNWLVLLVITGIFLGSYLSHNRVVLEKKFNPKLIGLYLRSQDIPDLPDNKVRVFLSDSEIYTASGYLYAKGASPIAYDFQHPPFIKYLFGYAIILFGNPLWIQLIFALALLFGTYLLGLRIFKEPIYAVLATLVLSADPLLGALAGEALLDLGQAVLVLFYLYFSLDKKPNLLLTGVLLGLLFASKFWAGGLFFFGLFSTFLLYRRQTSLSFLFKQLLVAGIVFNLTYFQTYWQNGFRFNNIYFQLKTLKYWFNHSVTSLPFASLFLFVSGFYQSWWGDKKLVFERLWSPLWPLGLISSMRTLWLAFRKTNTSSPIMLISLIPVLYLVYLGIQAPFNRYFILVLPYCYLALAQVMVDNIKES